MTVGVEVGVTGLEAGDESDVPLLLLAVAVKVSAVS